MTLVVVNPDPEHPPRNRLEAEQALGKVRADNPDVPPGRYRLHFTAKGWDVVRSDP